MTEPINLYDAKTHLSRLVDRAEAGEEIIIAKSGTPRARLVALARPPRRPGGWESGVWIAADFDAALPSDVLAGFLGDNGPQGRSPRALRARRPSPRKPKAGA